MQKIQKISLSFFFTLFCFGLGHAQGLKIVTGVPDFKIKITGCEAYGNSVIINALLENIGDKEERIVVYGGSTSDSFAVDDEGNQYSENSFQVQMGKESLSMVATGGTLYPETPVKLKIQIEGVPEAAKMFKKIALGVKCEDWGLNTNKKIQISNVPINREGDD